MLPYTAGVFQLPSGAVVLRLMTAIAQPTLVRLIHRIPQKCVGVKC